MRFRILLLDNEAWPREALKAKLIEAFYEVGFAQLVPFLEFYPSLNDELHAMDFQEAATECRNAANSADLAFVDARWGDSRALELYGADLLFMLEGAKVLSVPYTFADELEDELRSKPWYQTARYVLEPVFKSAGLDRLTEVIGPAVDAFRLKVREAARAGTLAETGLIDILGLAPLANRRRADVIRDLVNSSWSLFHFILHAPEQVRLAKGNVDQLQRELRRSVALAERALPTVAAELAVPDALSRACQWTNGPPDLITLSDYVARCSSLGRQASAFEEVANELLALHGLASGSPADAMIPGDAIANSDRVLRWDVATFVDCLARVFRAEATNSGPLEGRVFACANFGVAARAFRSPFSLDVRLDRGRLNMVAMSGDPFDTAARPLGAYFLNENANSTSLRGLMMSQLPLYARHFVVENSSGGNWNCVDLSRWTGDEPALFHVLSPADVEELTGAARVAPNAVSGDGVTITAGFDI